MARTHTFARFFSSFFGNEEATPVVVEKAYTSPALEKANLVIETNKVKKATLEEQTEGELAVVRELLKRQEAVRQATSAFKGSVKDLKKAEAALETARLKAEAAVEKTVALEEELECELSAWMYDESYVPSEDVVQEANTESVAAAPAVAEEEVEAEPVQPVSAPPAPAAWDGHSVSDLTAEQREAMGL